MWHNIAVIKNLNNRLHKFSMPSIHGFGSIIYTRMAMRTPVYIGKWTYNNKSLKIWLAQIKGIQLLKRLD